MKVRPVPLMYAAALAATFVALVAAVGVALHQHPPSATVQTPASFISPPDTHSGTLLAAPDGNYYLYGEEDSCGFRWEDTATQYCGVKVYKSADLTTWSKAKQLIDAASPFWVKTCMGQSTRPGWGCWRPKVVFNARTKKYVLWLATGADTGDQYMVLQSDTPDSGFTVVGQPDLHDQTVLSWDNQPAIDGDENLFVDHDGTAWIIYNRLGRLVEEQLDPTYTTGAGTPITAFNYPDVAPTHGVESPALFARNGTYYITMSIPRCAYCAGIPTGVMQAPTAQGPWTYMGTISDKSCNGQPNSVTRLPNGEYLWSTDQWHEQGVGTFPHFNETVAKQLWTKLDFKGDTIQPINCSPQNST